VPTSGEPQFSVRPVFIGWITFLIQLPLQLFFTVWAGGFFGGMLQAFGLFPRGSQLPFVVFGMLAFFGVPIVAYFGKKLNYSRTEYRFFADHLEFEEGFFSINKKVIMFRDSDAAQGDFPAHLWSWHDLSRHAGDRIDRQFQPVSRPRLR
jgi:hypothetical protein